MSGSSAVQRRRRLLAAGLAAALATVSVACGGDESSTATTAGGGSPTSAAGGDCGQRGDKGTINVFLIPSPSSTAIQSFIPDFEATTCIAVEFSETPYGEAHQKQLLAYQQGDGQYDIAQYDNTFLAPFGAAKAMTALDDYLKNSAEYDLADFSAGQQDYGKYDGQTLGLTLSTEPMIQWYRTDIYDELGLKPATTWDEFLSNAKAVKEAGKGDGALLGFGPNVSWWFMTLVWSFGGQLYDNDLKPAVNSPEAQAATEYLASLLPYAPDGAISATGDDVMFKFLAQDIGAIVNYSGYYGATLDPAANKYQGKIGTAPMPKGAADITHLAGWNIGIPADSKNKDQAWQFLEFVLGKSNAKAYLKSGAAAIGRSSITGDEALVAEQPYLKLLSIPAESRIERYPQLKVWPEMDVAITQAVTAILSGQTSVADGLAKLNDDLGPILAAENG
jgi:ABC-type glycerol-3-phosphate transport system substrate-binding protein